MTIWKFPLPEPPNPPQSVFEIEMPRGAKILAVQAQSEYPCIWALVRSDAPKVKRRFLVFGTGQEIQHEVIKAASPTGYVDPDWFEEDYVGTFQLYGGRLVFHVFDCGEVEAGVGSAAE